MNQITSQMTVEDVLGRWSETAVVFTQDFKTACVGCPIAPFDTLADIARIYDLDLDYILSRLQEVLDKSPQQRLE
jgi:hybrid cluster-associated redox disulfide protein